MHRAVVPHFPPPTCLLLRARNGPSPYVTCMRCRGRRVLTHYLAGSSVSAERVARWRRFAARSGRSPASKSAGCVHVSRRRSMRRRTAVSWRRDRGRSSSWVGTRECKRVPSLSPGGSPDLADRIVWRPLNLARKSRRSVGSLTTAVGCGGLWSTRSVNDVCEIFTTTSAGATYSSLARSGRYMAWMSAAYPRTVRAAFRHRDVQFEFGDGRVVDRAPELQKAHVPTGYRPESPTPPEFENGIVPVGVCARRKSTRLRCSRARSRRDGA